MKICFFDIEATDLKALMGRLLCVSFLPYGGEPYTFRVDERPWKSKDPISDLNLAVAVRQRLAQGGDDDLTFAIVAILDEAAQRIERL